MRRGETPRPQRNKGRWSEAGSNRRDEGSAPTGMMALSAAVTLAAGLLTVLSRNPVHSVLWLILAFFSTAGLFVLMGAEFVAMLLIIVYVGAVRCCSCSW
jgi:NADH:ubiquinone oxidoreductase subunit 6 (subunit J)